MLAKGCKSTCEYKCATVQKTIKFVPSSSFFEYHVLTKGLFALIKTGEHCRNPGKTCTMEVHVSEY